jgi:hypothetical protein
MYGYARGSKSFMAKWLTEKKALLDELSSEEREDLQKKADE